MTFVDLDIPLIDIVKVSPSPTIGHSPRQRNVHSAAGVEIDNSHRVVLAFDQRE